MRAFPSRGFAAFDTTGYLVGTLARFNIATDDGYKSSDGQRVERVTWHTVTAHGATANFCLKYLHKGELVYVQGAYISRKYRTKDGRDAVAWGVSASRVQFLDGSERGAQNRNCHDHQQGGYDDMYSKSPDEPYKRW